MKTRILATASCAAALMLAGCTMGAKYPSFAQTDYRIEGNAADAEGGMRKMVIYRNGPQMRVETTLADRGPAVIVFDEAANGAYVIDTATQTAMLAGEADTPQAYDATWAALGAENAQRVGDCTVAGERGDEWRAKTEAQGNVACITRDGIVLRVRDGERVVFEATALDRGTQQAALFGVPAGYRIVDPQAVLAQVGETMDQMDSVTQEGATVSTTTPPRTTTIPAQPKQ